jgi:RNase H-like domain found in reverse transcriptase/Integrase zinc binding domain
MLKECFMTNLILTTPNPEWELRIESDASDIATGAILSMKCEDEKWRLCTYYSKLLSDVERNYDVHDKEMLSIMRVLEQWRHHLEGAKFKFEIWSDHQNLQYFMGVKKLNWRQARWALYLSRFDFEMVNKPRASMGKADALSRRPDHKEGVENDNKEVTLLKPEFFAIWVLQQGHLSINRSEQGLLARVHRSKEMDESVVKAVEELKRSPTKWLWSEEWSEEQGLILFRGKVYVPKDIQLQWEIVRLHHDLPIAGHPGQWKTLELISWNYWWPGITKFVFDWKAHVTSDTDWAMEECICRLYCWTTNVARIWCLIGCQRLRQEADACSTYYYRDKCAGIS